MSDVISDTARVRLVNIIKHLPKDKTREAETFLKSLLPQKPGKKKQSFDEWLENKPFDDEPVTPEEEKGIIEAREQINRGECITFEALEKKIRLRKKSYRKSP